MKINRDVKVGHSKTCYDAILPATDPVHIGIQKVDRTTVAELDEIIGQHNEVQAQIDKADGGLNPLGVAAGAVPFDINPAQVTAATPLTHYEQISQRALTAVNNTLSIFNYANQLSQALRRNQDSQSQLQSNSTDKERDLKNRMIEIFGYPYAGDIGAGGTFPSGYDGPDFYHYMYVGATDLTGEPGVDCPASLVHPDDGQLIWMIDRDADRLRSGGWGDGGESDREPALE